MNVLDSAGLYNPERCPAYGSFFSAMRCAAVIFTVFGASYGTAKSSMAICATGIIRPERLMQNTDLVEQMPNHQDFLQLGAGLSMGLCGLAAGSPIGIVGDAGVRASMQQPRLCVGLILLLVFAGVPGLYGVIVSILILTKSRQNVNKCRF
ncbi:uncharacterized protein BCR38DRAFT_527088 [Pseudomassariella vexata]|uniref:V-ATPase proteolipid subunit C-like domain-containing protein n=1 Tax=Pseudomassariella vexata TaxID=1141098 RepID=A0A1Y2DJX8_9PEZI|nr:uncharacterized protein BCR38DRAFT_527088 [Pseudomassariella vexata]ORY59085.1 hypothetical protein BCR38DRAFT_527088 [Pseudomassariella vexata]